MGFLFASWVEYDNMMYFYHRDGILPMKYSIEKNKMDLAPEFDFAREIVRDYIDSYHRWNDLIIGLLEVGDTVVVWDMKRKLRRDIPIMARSRNWDNYAFSGIYKDKLYIVPRKYNATLNRVICVDFIKGDVQEEIVNVDNQLNFTYGFMKDNEILLTTDDGTYICRYDLEKKYSRLDGLFDKGSRIMDIHVDGDRIYFLRLSGEVMLVNMSTDNISMIAKGNGFEKSKLIVGTNKLVLLPYISGDIELVDITDNSREIYKEYPSDFSYLYDGVKFHNKIVKENKTYFTMTSTNYILIVDSEKDSISWSKPIMPPREDMMSYIFKNKSVFLQEGNLFLGDFLKGLSEIC